MNEWSPISDDACSYCGKLNGPLTQVRLGSSISWLCAACHSRQDERYAAMVAAEDSDESRWKEAAL